MLKGAPEKGLAALSLIKKTAQEMHLQQSSCPASLTKVKVYSVEKLDGRVKVS